MAIVKPFRALRPVPELVSKVAALPYDVVNTEEARKLVEGNEYSFLHVDRPEIDLADSVNIYDKIVYEKARDNLFEMIDKKVFIQEEMDCLYIYRLEWRGKVQTGIVACTSIDDYINDVIKKHEHTLAPKEQDRVNHVTFTNAHTGPIMMTYRENPDITSLIEAWMKNKTAIYDFKTDDVAQTVWKIDDDNVIHELVSLFKNVAALYIADGHHRAAAAVKVGQNMREKNPQYTGKEEFNFFLSVLFPHTDLTILEYNRLIRDKNGMTDEELLEKISEKFEVSYGFEEAFKPDTRHTFGMYISGKWYKLTAKTGSFCEKDPVDSLDVSILHNNIIAPIFGITNPRTDKRIDFVGGIRGLSELEQRVDSGEMQVAFSMYPTTMEDLMKIADASKTMPPKSTWFEPKLRSGIFIHPLI